ncbi:hypothetical protein NB643_08780 [Oxalobacter aliiformigenes]|nr:hypothetical protein [Oxalobacter aliiformigenes]WAV94888.1 hypothetical protein NB643_08780 [Oxalobacter aliiformigenes]
MFARTKNFPVFPDTLPGFGPEKNTSDSDILPENNLVSVKKAALTAAFLN